MLLYPALVVKYVFPLSTPRVTSIVDWAHWVAVTQQTLPVFLHMPTTKSIFFKGHHDARLTYNEQDYLEQAAMHCHLYWSHHNHANIRKIMSFKRTFFAVANELINLYNLIWVCAYSFRPWDAPTKAIIGSDNGLSPDRRQAIIWTNAGILLIVPWGTNLSAIEIQTFPSKKVHLKVSSAKWWQCGLHLDVLENKSVKLKTKHSKNPSPWHFCKCKQTKK